jgi:hypothetical protein
MLSAALVVFSLTRPAPAPVASVPPPAPVNTTTTASEAEIEQRIQAAVEKAMAAREQQQILHTRELVAELTQSRQRLELASQELELSQKRARVGRVFASNYAPPTETGDVK